MTTPCITRLQSWEQINLSLLSALFRFAVVVIIMMIIIVIIIFLIVIIIIISIITNTVIIIIKDGEAGWMQINLSLLSALTLTACLPCCLSEGKKTASAHQNHPQNISIVFVLIIAVACHLC